MKYFWISSCCITFFFSIPVSAQVDSGVRLSYINEQESLPKAVFGQNFYWKWESKSSKAISIPISFEANNKKIGFGCASPIIRSNLKYGTVSVAVEPIARGESGLISDLGKAIAHYGVFFIAEGDSSNPGTGMGSEGFYFGELTQGLTKDKWPTEYRGTPLKVVFRDGMLPLGKKVLLAESIRIKPNKDNVVSVPPKPKDEVHEFSIYITATEVKP